MLLLLFALSALCADDPASELLYACKVIDFEKSPIECVTCGSYYDEEANETVQAILKDGLCYLPHDLGCASTIGDTQEAICGTCIEYHYKLTAEAKYCTYIEAIDNDCIIMSDDDVYKCLRCWYGKMPDQDGKCVSCPKGTETYVDVDTTTEPYTYTQKCGTAAEIVAAQEKYGIEDCKEIVQCHYDMFYDPYWKGDKACDFTGFVCGTCVDTHYQDEDEEDIYMCRLCTDLKTNCDECSDETWCFKCSIGSMRDCYTNDECDGKCHDAQYFITKEVITHCEEGNVDNKTDIFECTKCKKTESVVAIDGDCVSCTDYGCEVQCEFDGTVVKCDSDGCSEEFFYKNSQCLHYSNDIGSFIDHCLDTEQAAPTAACEITCSECDDGYYLDVAAISDCGSVTKVNNCFDCQSKYGQSNPNDGRCVLCDETECTECEAGHFLLDGHCYSKRFIEDDTEDSFHCELFDELEPKFNCLTCSTGFYLTSNSNNQQVCGKCVPDNCAVCTNDGSTCLKCIDKYGFDDSGICTNVMDDVIPNCYEADLPNGICLQCDTNHYFDHDQGSCVSCDISSHDECQECDPEKWYWECKTCATDYFKNKQGECVTCPNCKSGCVKDVDSPLFGHCGECEDTYHPVSGQCTKCSDENPLCDECVTTSSALVCLTCSNPTLHYVNKLTKRCEECYVFGCSDTGCKILNLQPYCDMCDLPYYASNGACVLCPTGMSYNPYAGECESCSEEYKCTECSFGTDGMECTDSCVTGHTFDVDRCVGNVAYCVDYASDDECQKCEEYFILSEDRKSCTSPGVHEDCYYTLEDIEKENQQQCIICGMRTYPQNNTRCARCDGDTGTGTCVLCDQKTTFLRCLQCGKNTYPVNGVCVPCELAEGGKCLQCNGLALTSPEDHNCTLCVENHYAKDGECVSCLVNGCVRCTQDGSELGFVCLRCQDGQTINTPDHPDYVSGVVCVPCADLHNNCQTCDTTARRCTSCLNDSDSYYPSLDEGCTNCTELEECRHCQPDRTCTECLSEFLFDDLFPVGEYYPLNGTCSKCYNDRTCTKCRSDSPDLYCVECVENMYAKDGVCTSCIQGNCLQCLSGKTELFCTQCRNNTYPFGGICTSCVIPVAGNYKGCLRCDGTLLEGTEKPFCTACLSKYFPYEGECHICDVGDDCVSCMSVGRENPANMLDARVCISCRNNMYPLDGRCVTCESDNCLVCSPTAPYLYCTTCETGSHPINGVCVACNNNEEDVNCVECDPSSVAVKCTKCYQNSGENIFMYPLMIKDKITCVDCSTLANCVECDAVKLGGFCNKCANTHYSDHRGACQLCLLNLENPYCEQCDSISNCTSCQKGYLLDFDTDGNGYCVPCTERTGCISCGVGSVDDGNPFGFTCDECSAGSFPVNDGSGRFVKCELCENEPDGTKGYCLDCLSTISDSLAKTCTECSTGHYSNGSTCETCESADERCTDCDAGSPFTCTACNSNLYIPIDGVCSVCSGRFDYCEECDTATSTCTKCFAKLDVDGDMVEDVLFLESPVSCATCKGKMAGCVDCSSDAQFTFTCTLCDVGYYLNGENVCVLCSKISDGCDTCDYADGNAFCLTCLNDEEYYKDGDQICRSCKSINGCNLCEEGKSFCAECLDGFYMVGKVEDENTECRLCKYMDPLCTSCNSTGEFRCTACLVRDDVATNPVDGSCELCPTLAENLTTCHYDIGENLVCDSCAEGYYCNEDTVTNNDYCVSCSELKHCRVCSSAVQCDECFMYAEPVGPDCVLIGSENCTDFDTLGNCTACAANSFFLYNEQSLITCIPCSRVSGCAECESDLFDVVCTKCGSGQYPQDGAKCEDCANLYGCADCNIDDQSGYCISCTNDTYGLVNGKCVDCSKLFLDCATCDVSQCKTCIAGFYLDQDLSCKPCVGKGNCLKWENDTCSTALPVCEKCEVGYFVYQGECSQCDTNCLECDENGDCVRCDAETTLDLSGDCVQCTPADSPSHCLECGASIDVCEKCGSEAVDGEFYPILLGSVCVKCSDVDPSCTTCQQPEGIFECTACKKNAAEKDTFYLQNGYCVSCSNLDGECLQCEAGASGVVCTECPSDKTSIVLHEGRCTKCDSLYEGCSSCNSNGCLVCTVGYLRTLEVSTYVCKPCLFASENCISCEHETCFKCRSGYFIENSVCKECTELDDNCATCSDDKVCTSCRSVDDNGESVWMYLSDGECVDCSDIPKCVKCRNDSTGYCLECESTHYARNGACVQVDQFIDKCDELVVASSGYTCVQCKSGFYPSGSRCVDCTNIANCQMCDRQKTGVCTLCKDTAYFISNGACVQCTSLPNCEACEISNEVAIGRCGVCASGTFVKDGECLPCSALGNCVDCSSDGKCTKCTGSTFYISGGVCTAVSSTIENCSATSPTSAVAICVKCRDGFYPRQNTACAACTTLSNCLACPSTDATGRCTTCEEGYFPDSTFSCKKCDTITNCTTCLQNFVGGRCTACETGFFIGMDTCLPCSSFSAGCVACTKNIANAVSCTACEGEMVVENGICVDSARGLVVLLFAVILALLL